MRWSVNDIMELFKFLTRKNQSSSIRAKDLFYAWNAEQAMYHNDLVGRWQNRSNGKSGNNTGMILNETVISDLAPFILTTTLTIASGNADKPEDFIFKTALRINDQKVTIINHGQIPYVNNSVIDAPSESTDTYYATEYEDYYHFLPTSVTSAALDYVAAPTEVKWAYTLDSENRQVYNAGNSIQPKWSNNTIVEITKRALVNMGVSYKDQDFLNFGRTAQATGT